MIDVGAGGCDAAGGGRLRMKRAEVGRHLLVLRRADPAHGPAVARHAEAHLQRLPGADALQHRVRAVAAGQLTRQVCHHDTYGPRENPDREGVVPRVLIDEAEKKLEAAGIQETLVLDETLVYASYNPLQMGSSRAG